MLELETACNIAIVGISDYIEKENDKYSQNLKEYYTQKALYSVTKEAAQVKRQYGIQTGNIQQKPKEEVLKTKAEN